MNKITIEDYKTAIRAKYKIAIEEDVSGTLSDPTPAEFRDYYFRIFERGLSKIDKEIMEIFFEANENSPLKKAIENCNTGKLKAIIHFLNGKDTRNRTRVEMAAILVDFKPRPLKIFLEKRGIIEEEKIEIGNISISEPTSIENEDRIMTKYKNEDEIEDVSNDDIIIGKLSEKFSDKLKFTIAGIVAVFCLGFLISYYLFPKKQCMQWSNDHYEKVICDLESNGFLSNVGLEPFDERKFELKKLKACDTTSFFKLGRPCVWYGKSTDGNYECFSAPGLHPETGITLRPITEYMISKHILKKKE
ncbi:hypothetical protein [Flavobacterium piscis]|uniref:Uncharacterized protein n=1 Tax=Flavobacterium piscis TaxID=1114874 RepID=A0ABU1YEL3_9FLAO|nr:hypothetical protein [Flavobacterium piscis]MDR7212664.1 hypothetical protein [Flavobacterium piscis]